ncbi:MAG: acetoacetate--CoA ligase [Cyclobacteriaceae bacterium]
MSRLLWTPDRATSEGSNLVAFMHWLEKEHGLSFTGYAALWKWSIEDIDSFWKILWQYFDIQADGKIDKVTSGRDMPGVRWFEGTSLNYAEHIFRGKKDEAVAIMYASEAEPLHSMSWKELKSKTAAFREYLISAGIKKGDCVVGYLPCIPEATIAFLAANSLGAIWSSCSPDFGTQSVIDRFAQIEPKVLVAVEEYQYGGKRYGKVEVVQGIVDAIPTIAKVVVVGAKGSRHASWADIIDKSSEPLSFTRVPFNHPIWVLYSSGTTGLPKAITHSHGGILLEQYKYGILHNDVKPGDRCFWYTTTGWMMWNYIQSVLLGDAVMILYDGSPAYPDMNVLWKLAADTRMNHFGTSAGFILANMKAHTEPGRDFDLSRLRSIGSTGSTLPPEGFNWVYQKVKSNLWLASMSGGTDVCSAFVGGLPTQPVYEGEIQCRALGCALYAFNDDGKAVKNEVGEMVITKPMPSMPIYFWNDPDFERYRESYFEMYPGIWRHGDWIEITDHDGIVIYGRSDATLNRGGVRIGTSEIYRAVDQVKEVKDSLILCVELAEGEFYMPLFVQLQEGNTLTEELKKRIRDTIRNTYSPRHVPDEILVTPDIPYTISGKKTEPPVKKIFMGKDPEKVVNKGALRNPESIQFYINFYNQHLKNKR